MFTHALVSLLIASLPTLVPATPLHVADYSKYSEASLQPKCLEGRERGTICLPTELAAWRDDIARWRTQRRQYIAYSGARYDVPRTAWIGKDILQAASTRC